MSSHPTRGDRSAYERYLAGMDASMKQKVALTAAHLLCEGRVADMGMGSGGGSFALASLYPELSVVGVDLDPNMVALARETHRLPNLAFEVGDIAERVFSDGSLDGIFDSSVLHHVTSFGGYDHEAAARALRAQVSALRSNGVVVVRDFLHPGSGDVLLDLPDDDGVPSGEGPALADPRTCSTAALFERFAREFRSLHAAPGFPARRDAGPSHVPVPKGHVRFATSLHHAVEFVLRKDYRQDWEGEVKEEYGYFTQARFEASFAELGLRVLASTPIRNPWIVRNRFDGKFVLRDPDGTERETPATNYVIVGERVAKGEGVAFEDLGDVPARGFLEMTRWVDTRTGAIRDLVRRPHLTVDVVPWFTSGGDVFVLARTSYPRPILGSTARADVSLDGARAPGWVAEPLVVLQEDKPLAQTVEEALSRDARVAPSSIRGFRTGSTYYPSPGGTQEEVRAVFVEIDPVFVEEHLPPSSGFSTSGRIRAIEARQLLRSAQVGGLPDARLEVNAKELLRHLGRDPGPWIGESVPSLTSLDVARTTWTELAGRAKRRVYRKDEGTKHPPFLAIRTRRFLEKDAAGATLATADLELVVPVSSSQNTLAVAPLALVGGVPCFGIDDDDLPAVQCFEGHSGLLVAPAWRVPRTVASMRGAKAFAKERLLREYGVTASDFTELGGRYHPSPGLSPEVVLPFAAIVSAVVPAARTLVWVAISELVAHATSLSDGHLKVLASRASHAAGIG
ncbi:MAG: class I SAM-dependent methyltransferase [Polyangiaceae bacterium]